MFILTNSTTDYIYDELCRYKLNQGEVIFAVAQNKDSHDPIEDIVGKFLEFFNIRIDYHYYPLKHADLNLISKNEAITIFKKTLTDKNYYYAFFENPLDDTQIKNLNQQFFSLFYNQPKYYTIHDIYLYKQEIPFGDIRSSNGIIVCDQSNIGIFWLNEYGQY